MRSADSLSLLLSTSATLESVELILSDKSAIVGNNQPLTLLLFNALRAAGFTLKLASATRDIGASTTAGKRRSVDIIKKRRRTAAQKA
eukprot:9221524-Pyramimonas_sp.AAC.1